MAKKRKDPNQVSSFYTTEKAKVQPELAIREAYLRATVETLDCFGVDKYSVERLRGMNDLLEQFVNLEL